MTRPRAVIAGGGTTGHVGPALAVAEALVARGWNPDDIVFVGSRRGIETRLVPAAGFALVTLPGRGIERRVSLAAAKAMLALLWGTLRGIALIGRLRPGVVLSVGGYASVPCILGAALWRVPLVVTEQNAVPSAANRLAGHFAKACAVAFPDTDLPRTVVTGNPVRAEVATLGVADHQQRRAARHRLGVPNDRHVVLVTGGSLGARRINDAVVAALDLWDGDADLAVYHVAGPRDRDAVADAVGDRRADQDPWYRLVGYEDRMADAYAAADLALARSGASTVSELAIVGLPAVLVPLPIAPNDAQGRNAAALSEVGAAVMVRDDELDAPRLVAEIGRLLDEPGRLAAMRTALGGLGRPDAAARVADLVEQHERTTRGSVT